VNLSNAMRLILSGCAISLLVSCGTVPLCREPPAELAMPPNPALIKDLEKTLGVCSEDASENCTDTGR